MSETQAIPQKIYLLGGGRDTHTRDQRRKHRFSRRAFQIGGLPIRPSRRVDVTMEFVVKHLDEIIVKVKAGTLIVQHAHDRFVDERELRAMVAQFRGEPAKTAEPVLPPPGDPLPPTDPPPPPGPEDLTVAPDETGEPEGVEPGFDEDQGDEPSAPEEPEPAQDQAVDEPHDDMLDPEPEPEPEGIFEEPLEAVAEEAPVMEEPEAPVDEAVEPAAEQRFLPEGWETKTKKELIAFCEERGIKVEGKPSNDTLIGLLNTWLKGA